MNYVEHFLIYILFSFPSCDVDENLFWLFGMNFDTKPIGWKHDKLFDGLCDASSASQSDNAAFRCDDEDNTKEEEVYQDLCAIQSSIARNREQVFIKFCRNSYFIA